MRQPFAVRHIDEIPVVEVFGEADLATLDELETCFADAAGSPSETILVSLLHAKYFDSSTVHALLGFHERLRRSGRRLIIVAPSGDSGRRILAIFGIAMRVPVIDSLTDAVAAAKVGTPLEPENPFAN